MYDHIIEEQVNALVKAKLLPKARVKKAMKVLRKECWTDQMALVWTAEDIHDLAEQKGKDITNERARDVLAEAAHGHDASVGVNWDVLSALL